MSPRKKMDDLENGTNTTDKYTNDKSYLENLRIDLLFFNILKLKVIENNKDYINIKKFITQEDLHSMECSIDYVEKRMFMAIEQGLIDLRPFDDDEMQDEKAYEAFLKKCRVQSIKPEKMIIQENGKRIINKEIYHKYFLEVKINDKGMSKIEEINDEIKRMIKQNSRVYNNLEKIKSFSDAMGNYKSVVGGLIILLLGFSIVLISPANKYVANIPYIGSIIKSDIKDSFVELNLNKQGNEEIKSKLVTSSDAIQNMYINETIPEMSIYMIEFSDRSYKYISIVDNKIQFLTEEKIRKLLK